MLKIDRKSKGLVNFPMVPVTSLIPGRFGFLCASPATVKQIQQSEQGETIRFISSDLHRQYFPIAADFGPVNLGVVHRFCAAFSKRLKKQEGKLLVYCFEESLGAQANACFLLGSLLVLNYGWTAEAAAQPFTGPSSPVTLRPFRDATFHTCTYPLLLLDCLKGLSKSVQLGWFDAGTFNVTQYTHYDDPCTGDMHRICPKFVAFKGPLAEDSPQSDEVAFSPEHYAPLLLDLGVTCVVRLNEADTYDAAAFTRAGIAHHDLFFPDCTTPPDDVVERFLDICDKTSGAVAVHCRAGLGRTGTLIGVWMMKHAGFGADEAIGWLRIVRPGSVIGRQQAYLKACEGRRWRGNVLLPPDDARVPLGVQLSLQEEMDTAEVARQVTAGMCARGRDKAAAGAAGAAVAAGCRVRPDAGRSDIGRIGADGAGVRAAR